MWSREDKSDSNDGSEHIAIHGYDELKITTTHADETRQCFNLFSEDELATYVEDSARVRLRSSLGSVIQGRRELHTSLKGT